LETVVSDTEALAETSEDTVLASQRDRYAAIVRGTGAVISGLIAGVLLVSSIQVGVAFALGEDQLEWNTLEWNDHWMWRGAASLAATSAAAFIAGMIARRRGQLIASLSVAPSVLYWSVVAYAGFVGHIPGIAAVDVPVGYRIVAVLLAVASLPLAAAYGREGAAYGHANARHFDSRRGALLGIRWYQFLWLPILIHLMVTTAAFGGVYGFQWLTAAWKTSMSLFGIVPVFFLIAMLATLQLLGNGALGTYQALAGFDDRSGTSTFRRVLKFGLGYTVLTALAQSGITLGHYGLATLLRTIFG
jgi:hypothetical protein